MTTTFQLESSDLTLRGDASHGGEILDLVERSDGQQLLGKAPGPTSSVARGELDERTWTRSYRGGWQLLVPNAGSACSLVGRDYGFHGRASTEPWRLDHLRRSSARLTWKGHGLHVEREIRLEQTDVRVSTRARVTRAEEPFVVVEHCTLGQVFVQPGLEIDLPPGTAFELSDGEGPPTAPAAATKWPAVRMSDGRWEKPRDWRMDRPLARFIAVADLPAGWARVRNPQTGRGFELSWNTDVLPHLWLWLENRVTEEPWRREAKILGLEPASVPHAHGLATAVENDQAFCRQEGGVVEWEITARVCEH